jgi:DUF4097 and DUF4098 domain-containing protein YvlB
MTHLLKNTLLAGLTVGFLTTSSAFALTKEFSQTYPLKAGGAVSLDNVNGDVTITSWDRDEVSVEATIESKSQSGLDRIEVIVKATSTSVRIETDYEENHRSRWNDGGEVTYIVKIPRGAELREVDLVNGDLKVEGISGKIEASTVNGKITVSDLAGDAKLDTVNGSIEAAFDQVGGTQRIDIESVNGSVTVRLPRNADAEVDISTVHGGIRNDFGLDVDDGDYVGHDLRGRLGSGGARIHIENVNGAVKLLAN